MPTGWSQLYSYSWRIEQAVERHDWEGAISFVKVALNEINFYHDDKSAQELLYTAVAAMELTQHEYLAGRCYAQLGYEGLPDADSVPIPVIHRMMRMGVGLMAWLHEDSVDTRQNQLYGRTLELIAS